MKLQIKGIIESQFLFKEINALKQLIKQFTDELDKETYTIEKLTGEMSELKKVIVHAR